MIQRYLSIDADAWRKRTLCLVSACYSICKYIYALRKPHNLVKQCVKKMISETFRSWCQAGGSAILGGPRSMRAI